MGTVENLSVRQEGISLAKKVYLLTNQNEKLKKDFSLKDQMQRCSVSVSSNIAEGSNRGSDKEFLRFLYISRGSCSELGTQLLISKEIGYLSQGEFDIID